MKFIILTLLLVIHTSYCLKKLPEELKHSKKATASECQEISCPPTEDPVCMKLKNRNSNATVFVRLLNKCEMGYMKCHKDTEGSVVPMKYCDHIHLITATKKMSHTRRKRSLTNDGEAEFKVFKKSARFQLKKKALREPKTDEGDEENPSDEKDPVFVVSSLETDTFKCGGAVAKGDNTFNCGTAVGKDDSTDEADSENEDFLGENDYDDKFRADCPTACPSRVKLVCAKCDHGVYKTFLSACHVRMFNCEQKNEKMELVSRSSCVYSSPLLKADDVPNNVNLEPEGKVYDRDDGDPVLAFIRCRNRNSMLVDEQGLEVIDADACKNIAQEMRKDKDYDK